MGDFLPPLQPGHSAAGTAAAAAAEQDRLRRRFERYRQLHASRQQQYDSFATGAYHQQAHETQLLHRRWQDSKKPATTAAKSAAAVAAKMPSRTGDAVPCGGGGTGSTAAAGNVTTV